MSIRLFLEDVGRGRGKEKPDTESFNLASLPATDQSSVSLPERDRNRGLRTLS